MYKGNCMFYERYFSFVDQLDDFIIQNDLYKNSVGIDFLMFLIQTVFHKHFQCIMIMITNK